MSLVQVARQTITSPVSSLSITGISTDDAYLLTLNNVVAGTANARLELRFTESGTANTTSNYDKADVFIASSGKSNNYATNQTYINIFGNQPTSNYTCGLLYIYNANNSSEHTFCTFEQTGWDNGAVVGGRQGGGTFTVTSQVDGVNLFMGNTGGTINAGTFTLYKVI